jgi:monoamine oxidase
MATATAHEATHATHATPDAPVPSVTTALHLVTTPLSPTRRAAAIGVFSASVLALRLNAAERYRQHLTRLLQARQTEQLTQRALLACVDQCYSEALVKLDPLLPDLDTAHADVVNGRHALGAALLAPFEGWSKALLEAALAFNAGSCAVSNFPHEHQHDAMSLRAITLDLAAAWREFAIELNTRLLAAAEHARQRAPVHGAAAPAEALP